MRAYQIPEILLAELGITEPSDVDVEAIAQYCGATVRYSYLSGCEARLLGYRDRAIITVRKNAPRGRQRFSAAHELGHWMRDRNRVAYACNETMFKTEWKEDNPERRANRYAAALLLPKEMFRKATLGKLVTFASVRELAALFQTSFTATAIRLVEVGPSPALVVCSGKDRRKWFFRGEDVPLWPVERPGPDTVAYDLLRDANVANPSGPLEVCADGWIDHPDASRYALVEDSRRIGPELVLSLLWWKDERQLLDLVEEEGGPVDK